MESTHLEQLPTVTLLSISSPPYPFSLYSHSFIFPFSPSNPHVSSPHLALSLYPWVFYPVIASFFNLNL